MLLLLLMIISIPYVYFLVIRFPEIALTAIMVINYSGGMSEYTDIGVTKFIFVPVILGSIWHLLTSKSRGININNLFHGLVILFAMWITLNLFANSDYDISYGFMKLVSFVIYSLIPFYASTILIDSPKRLNRFIICYVILLFIITSIIYYMFGGNTYQQEHLQAQGRFSVFTDSINFSTPFIAGIIISYYLLVSEKNRYLKLMSLLSIGFFIYMVVLIGERQSIVASIAGILLLLVFTAKRFGFNLKSCFYLISVIFLINTFIGYIDVDALSNRYDTALKDPMASMESRFGYYAQTLNVFKISPIMGVGLGEFGRWTRTGDLTDHAHNLFLEVLAEQGIIGFCLFIAIIWLPLKRGLLYIYKSKPSDTNFMPTCLFVSLTIASLLQSCASGGIGDKTILWPCLAILWSLTNSYNFAKTPAVHHQFQLMDRFGGPTYPEKRA